MELILLCRRKVPWVLVYLVGTPTRQGACELDSTDLRGIEWENSLLSGRPCVLDEGGDAGQWALVSCGCGGGFRLVILAESLNFLSYAWHVGWLWLMWSLAVVVVLGGSRVEDGGVACGMEAC